MNVIKPDEIKIEKLNEFHNLSKFDSYEKDLVDFLREDALNNQKQSLSLTFLWFYQEDITGYITLLTDKTSLEEELKNVFLNKNINYKSFPALKIGRLCVHDKYLRKGLGRLMACFAMQKAIEINKDKAGCRFITVDAKKQLGIINFYKKLNFKVLKERNDKTMPMFLDLKTDIFINKGGINPI